MRVDRRFMLGLAIVSATACGAGWQREALPQAGAIDPRQQVQIWSHHGLLRWHAIRLTADSISGLPYVALLTCDSCRSTLPMTEVDSVRYGNPTAGFLKSLGLFLGIALGVALVFCCPAST